MAESDSAGQRGRGGFGRGFGGRGGGERGGRGGRGGFRGRGDGDRGRGRGGARGGRGKEEEGTWTPVTKLGRLVKDNQIKSLEEVFLFSLPIKEHQIVDTFLPKEKLKDEVMKIMPVQKQTAAGQRTRFKAFVVVGDHDGHVGLGVKCAKEVATAIRGAIIQAKLAIVPVRRGYWGNLIGQPHTVPSKITGKCGSVRLRLVPAPRGTGIVAARVPKKVLQMAGVSDVYTQARGSTKTLGNFVKATFSALAGTYGFLTPNLWKQYRLQKVPYHEHSAFLANTGKRTHAAKAEKLRRDDAPAAAAAPAPAAAAVAPPPAAAPVPTAAGPRV